MDAGYILRTLYSPPLFHFEQPGKALKLWMFLTGETQNTSALKTSLILPSVSDLYQAERTAAPLASSLISSL